MSAIGVGAIYFGGAFFLFVVAISVGLMVWELSRMVAPDARREAMLRGFASGVVLVLVPYLDAVLIGAIALVLVLSAAVTVASFRQSFVLYFLALLVAGYGLITFRALHGGTWLFWLVLVVIVTDIAGYFAGRLIGGPKFMPRISPKKTWSGTVAGWIAAGLVGWYFISITRAGWDLLWISMMLAFASQLGDIAESALKRRVGVKDSSNLIPGHGGLYDRFDGLLGATLFMLLVALIVDVPDVIIR